MTRQHDWRIVLEPISDPDWVGGSGTLEIIHGDEEDAVSQLEYWADILKSGKIPRSMDWQNESFCSVQGRKGKFSFRVRVDSFERETDTGMTSGAGYLRVRMASQCQFAECECE